MDVVYSTKATSTGGREGRSATEDGRLSVQLSTPKELGVLAAPEPTPSNCSPPVIQPASSVPSNLLPGKTKSSCPPNLKLPPLWALVATPRAWALPSPLTC